MFLRIRIYRSDNDFDVLEDGSDQGKSLWDDGLSVVKDRGTKTTPISIEISQWFVCSADRRCITTNLSRK